MPTDLPEEPKISIEEFVFQSIDELHIPDPRHPDREKGIHVVMSGFNNSFRAYFGEDPRPHIDAMVKKGQLRQIIARKGPIIVLNPSGVPQLTREEETARTLAKILGLD